MAKFVTSDWHLNHNNIFGLDGFTQTRKHFKTKDEMNYAIIEAINAVTTKEDVLYHLGDIGFGSPKVLFELLEMINPRMVFVGGNHDNSKLKKYILNNNYETKYGMRYEYHDVGFKEKRDGKVYLFSHYPIGLGDYRANLRNICGHIHEETPSGWNVLNVGVDSPELPKELPFGQPLKLDDAMDLVEDKWNTQKCLYENYHAVDSNLDSLIENIFELDREGDDYLQWNDAGADDFYDHLAKDYRSVALALASQIKTKLNGGN